MWTFTESFRYSRSCFCLHCLFLVVYVRMGTYYCAFLNWRNLIFLRIVGIWRYQLIVRWPFLFIYVLNFIQRSFILFLMIPQRRGYTKQCLRIYFHWNVLFYCCLHLRVVLTNVSLDLFYVYFLPFFPWVPLFRTFTIAFADTFLGAVLWDSYFLFFFLYWEIRQDFITVVLFIR